MFDDLRGKQVLVTGASSGLGLHFAKLLSRHGAAVTLAARRVDRLAAICSEINGAGGSAAALELNVADAASVKKALSGHPGFDILVNNAGVAHSGAALELGDAEWDRVLDTNLKGAFTVSRVVAEGMKQRGGGAIVNVASILGLRVAGGVAAYAASKAGLVQLTKALALEWARFGIRVNALCPGYIETDINRDFFASEAGQKMLKRIPQRRIGTPEDLDGALLLLASRAGSYITGTTLAVDGGHLVSSL